MYNLIEYSDNYSKTSGSLWQYYKDDPNDNIKSESFKSKIKITQKTPAAGNAKNVEIAVPFLGRLLGPLLKKGLPLIKKYKPLAKSVFIPLGLTAAASAVDAGIHKKILRSSHHPSSSALHNDNTILIMSNDEMKDIIKIVKSFEDSRLLPEGVSEIIQSEAKKQRRGFLSMLLGTLCASLLRNILTCKGAIAKRQGRGINRAGEGIVRAGY